MHRDRHETLVAFMFECDAKHFQLNHRYTAQHQPNPYCATLSHTILIYTTSHYTTPHHTTLHTILHTPHSAVHATILRCAQTPRGGNGSSKSPDRLNFLRATKYCIAGSLFSLFDVRHTPTLTSSLISQSSVNELTHFLIKITASKSTS